MESLYTTTTFLSIITFAIATAFTPGPNNLMLLSSGLTFGYKRTLPHIFGVALGFPVMVLAVGLGVDILFGLHPWIYPTLKIVGLLYLLWMAWHIATSSSTIKIDDKASKPFTFLQSALFQWVNPKAWMMAVTVTSTYTDADKSMFLQVLVIALIYAVVGIGSTHSWALGGVYLTTWLKSERSVRVFNIVMAVLIVASVLPFMLS